MLLKDKRLVSQINGKTSYTWPEAMHAESPRYETEGKGTTTDISWRGVNPLRSLKASLLPFWGVRWQRQLTDRAFQVYRKSLNLIENSPWLVG